MKKAKAEKSNRFVPHGEKPLYHTWIKITKDLQWKKGDLKPPYFCCNTCGKIRKEQPKRYKEPPEECQHRSIQQIELKKGGIAHQCYSCRLPITIHVQTIPKAPVAPPTEEKRYPRTKANRVRAAKKTVKRARRLLRRGKLTRKLLWKLYRRWIAYLGLETSKKRLRRFVRRVGANKEWMR